MNKKDLSESDICDLYITPAIKRAGWDQMTQIRREVTLSPGPVVVRGNMSSRNKKKRKFADYVLSWEPVRCGVRQQRKSRTTILMSVKSLKAEVASCRWHFRFVPTPDIRIV